MRISVKIIFFLIVAFFLVTLSLSIISATGLLKNQKDNLKISNNELLEISRELVQDNAAFFFRLLDKRIKESPGLSNEELLSMINEIDPLYNHSTVVMDIEKRALLGGTERSEIGRLLDQRTVQGFLGEMTLNRTKDFYLDNYEKVRADKEGLVIPSAAHFRIYDSLGVIVGHGRVMKTALVRIDFIKKKNEDYFKFYLFFSLFIYAGATILAVFFSVRFMRIFFISPLRQIGSMVKQVAKGDLRARVTIQSRDEIGDLARAVNEMTRDLQNSTTSVDNLNQEIAGRKKIEAELRVEKEKAQKYLDVAGVMLLVIDLNGKVSMINKKGCEILGYTEKEIIGKDWFERFLTQKNADGIKKVFDKNMGKDAGEFIGYYENYILNKYGGEKLIAWHNVALRDENNKIIGSLSSGEDITEQRKAEEDLKSAYSKLKETQAQLLQSAKMASVGQLASGVAHEINNPLTGVLNNVQLIKIEAERRPDFKPDDFKELLGIIEDSAMRCKKITQALLDFSHASKARMEAVSLNEIAQKVITLLSHEMKLENINIREDFQQELPKIQGEPQLLQQVFFDLLVNARWAIKKKSKEGGLITIHTSYNAPAREVEVSVSDTGIGISRENLDKIFEPFFTTKEVGEGTGLGLSMVYSIVTNHNGTIRAESVLNKGATFNMRFPVQPV